MIGRPGSVSRRATSHLGVLLTATLTASTDTGLGEDDRLAIASFEDAQRWAEPVEGRLPESGAAMTEAAMHAAAGRRRHRRGRHAHDHAADRLGGAEQSELRVVGLLPLAVDDVRLDTAPTAGDDLTALSTEIGDLRAGERADRRSRAC